MVGVLLAAFGPVCKEAKVLFLPYEGALPLSSADAGMLSHNGPCPSPQNRIPWAAPARYQK
jgi:hypothetical protein